MTDHPLTETAAAELWDASRDPGRRLADRYEEMYHDDRATAVAALRAAFDAGREHERANPEDDRPWEPLNGPVRVGDEVRREADGTWYVRRAALELPPEHDGVVLVPADGHEAITTKDGQEFARLTFTTKQSIWYGPNLAARPGDWVIQTTAPGRLTLGTWKVDGEDAAR